MPDIFHLYFAPTLDTSIDRR